MTEKKKTIIYKEVKKHSRGKNRVFSGKNEGFSLIEVIISIVLVGIALLGLAQLFTLSMMNNRNSDRISRGTFLAQQQIERFRNLTADEISAIPSPNIDEIDINRDGTIDFKRITLIERSGSYWKVKVLIFSRANSTVGDDQLIQDPDKYRVRAKITTIIGR